MYDCKHHCNFRLSNFLTSKYFLALNKRSKVARVFNKYDFNDWSYTSYHIRIIYLLRKISKKQKK